MALGAAWAHRYGVPQRGGWATSWDFFPPRLNPGLLNKERESYLDSDVTFSSPFEQQEDVNSMLRQTFLGSGFDPHSPQIPRYPGLPLLSPRARFLPGFPDLASVTERGALLRPSGTLL